MRARTRWALVSGVALLTLGWLTLKVVEGDRGTPPEPPPATPAVEWTEHVLRVLDPEGHAVPAAYIQVWPVNDELRGEHHRADAEGPIAFSTLRPRSDLRLEARAADHGSSGVVALQEVPPAPDGAREIRLRALDAVAGVVTGVVLNDDGVLVAGAQISASTRDYIRRGTLAPVPAPVESDDQGRFRLELLGAGSYEVTARHLGARSDPITVIPSRDRSFELELRLGGAGRLEGRVLAPDGVPSPGASVHLREMDRSAPSSARPASKSIRFNERCDEQGRFVLELSHGGSFVLFASDEQHACSEPLELSLAPREKRADVELLLAAGATIEGRVLDEVGEPLAGVLVSALCDWRDPACEPPHDMLPTEYYHGCPRALTDESGRFRLGPLRAGLATYVVTCTPEPAQRKRVQHERGIRAGATDVELVLTEERLRGAFVRARVTLESAADPPDQVAMRLSILRQDGVWRPTRSYEVPLADGEFLLEGLELGFAYNLCLLHGRPGLPFFSESFVATLGGTRIDIELARPREVELRLRLYRSATKAAGTMTIESTLAYPGQRDQYPVRHDSAGVARVSLPPGTYLVRRQQYARDAHAVRVLPVDGLQVLQIE